MQKRSPVILGAKNNAVKKFSVMRDAIHLARVILYAINRLQSHNTYGQLLIVFSYNLEINR